MAKDQPFLTQYSQYLALRAFASIVPCFDVEQNLHTAAAIGSMFYRLSPKRRHRAEFNLAMSFPEWDTDRVASVAERSMQYMFQLFLVDALVTPRLITHSSWTRHIRIGSAQKLLEHLIRSEPLIMITGHCGNWELLGQAFGMIGYPPAALARPLDNEFVNRWLLKQRERSGTRIITKWGATPVVDQILESGGRIAFIADQNAGDQGLFVPFFGRLASTYKSIGLLAMRHQVPIAVGWAKRLNDRMTYEMSCIDFLMPRDWADQPDPLFYITARFNRALEAIIRESPEQYLWVHRRWKSRPRHERQEKPMPEHLIDKLRSLPWMTENELQVIVERSERGLGRESPAAH